MIKFAPALFVFLLFAACKKEVVEVTVPVKFTSTTYQSLAGFNSSGTPDNLLAPDVISTDMLSFIKNTLPDTKDLRITNPNLLSSKAIGDIPITRVSDVYITFVAQGTSAKNTFAFYSYSSSAPPASAKDISTITYIFPNAGNGTTLKAGDKVKIGTFSKGVSIGFVLLNNAWNSAIGKVNNGATHFCSNDVLNPEVDSDLKKHGVLVNYPSENKVLIGFEDVDRTNQYCDHDFGDLIVYATVVDL